MNTNWSPFLQGRSGVDLNVPLPSPSRVPSGTGAEAPGPGRRPPRVGASPHRRFRLVPLVSLLARK